MLKNIEFIDQAAGTPSQAGYPVAAIEKQGERDRKISENPDFLLTFHPFY